MIAVVDANFFIDKETLHSEISQIFVPSSVVAELRDRQTAEFFDFYAFKVTVRDPEEAYVAEVREHVRNKHYQLSGPDVDVVALTVELEDRGSMEWSGAGAAAPAEEVRCLTKDNGIKSALLSMGCFVAGEFQEKRYKLRCFACFALYDEEALDFCRKCGYSTVNRVAVVGEGADEKVLLKASYRYRPRIVKDAAGRVLRSADQREYVQFKRQQGYRGRQPPL